MVLRAWIIGSIFLGLVCPCLVIAEQAGGKPFSSFPANKAKSGTVTMPVPALARFIDQEINKVLEEEKVPVSPVADDAEFLRRVYLDITGVIPPYEKTVAFLDSKDPDKRARLIDELLTDPHHARHLADSWTPRLFVNPSYKRTQKIHAWLEEQFTKNQPWDKVVFDILTCMEKSPPTQFFFENVTVADATEATARAFLGIQLQCAQCHDHPFNEWKQSDYWGMAAFYSKLSRYVQKRPTRVFEEDGKRSFFDPPEGFVKAVPGFLTGEKPKLDLAEPFRPVLAGWIISAENPFFGRAFANRTWAHFFGRGLVHPVDDQGEHNPPSHPQLLQVLAEQFIASGFDARHLIRAICNSQTYQRTSRPLPGNAENQILFCHQAVRTLTPLQLSNSRIRLLGPQGGGNPFLRYFDLDSETSPTDYTYGIPQTLMMLNSGTANKPSAFLKQVVQLNDPPQKNIETLFLHVLSRRPAAKESEKLTHYVNARPQGQQMKAYEDIVWVLLNSAEFMMNR